jgi:hypothetical protein
MPHARHYETFEVRAMLKNAEGVASPVTGIGAHSRVLHALSTPGGEGVDNAGMMYRTHKQVGESNNAFKNRGGAVQTSAFANLIQQSDAACQALNSSKGYEALSVFDATQHANKYLRLVLDASGIREIGFLNLGPGRMKTVGKNDTSVTKTQANGVRLIIDRGPSATAFHIQTCFPLSNLGASTYEVTDMGNGLKQVIASG